MDQIFIYSIEDARAGCWRSELAVRAPSARKAMLRLREAGVRKSQFRDERPSRMLSLDEMPEATLGPQDIARRADEDGWTPWAPVIEGDLLNWRRSDEVSVGGGIGGAFRRSKPSGER
jgi:hypothetical protein